MISFINKSLLKKTNLNFLNNKEYKLFITTEKHFVLKNKQNNIKYTTFYHNNNNIDYKPNIYLTYCNMKYFSKKTKKKFDQKKEKEISDDYYEEDNVPTYTDNELKLLKKSDNLTEIKIMEIKPELYTKLMALKISGLISLFVGCLNIFIRESFENSFLQCFSDTQFFILNSILLYFGIGSIYLQRHIVILLTYFPKENILTFTKLNTFLIKKTSHNDPDNLARVKYKYSPLIFLRNKNTIEYFSMTGIGKWYEEKLFNTLIPARKVVKKKKKEKVEINKMLSETVKTVFKVYSVILFVLFLMSIRKRKNKSKENKVSEIESDKDEIKKM